MTATDVDNEVVRAWRDLLAQKTAIWSALEHSLEQYRLGVTEFEVLDRLAEKGEHGGFRVQELADAVCLSQSALSRVIGRLEQDGLVTRSICDQDRRGIYVCLTEQGTQRYLAARPAHRAALTATLGGY